MQVRAKFASKLTAAVLLAFGPSGALAEPLVVNGHEIADAELYSAALEEGGIVIYGSLPARNFEPVEAAFERDAGIDVEYINLITPRLYERATTEFGAGQLRADWVDTTDPLLTRELTALGVLAPYRVPNFDMLAENLRDDEGHWYAVFRTPIILAVNSALVEESEHPQSWEDLLKPEWEGRIGLPTIDAGGSWFNHFSFLEEVVGDDYWERLAAQNPRLYPSSAPMLTDLVRGEVAAALSSPASVNSQVEVGAPLEPIFPEEGVSAYATTGGITSVAPHPNAAQVYLNWLTSVPGGNAIAESRIYGINPDASAPEAEGLTFPEPASLWSMSVQDWADNLEPYTTEWRQTFGSQ